MQIWRSARDIAASLSAPVSSRRGTLGALSAAASGAGYPLKVAKVCRPRSTSQHPGWYRPDARPSPSRVDKVHNRPTGPKVCELRKVGSALARCAAVRLAVFLRRRGALRALGNRVARIRRSKGEGRALYSLLTLRQQTDCQAAPRSDHHRLTQVHGHTNPPGGRGRSPHYHPPTTSPPLVPYLNERPVSMVRHAIPATRPQLYVAAASRFRRPSELHQPHVPFCPRRPYYHESAYGFERSSDLTLAINLEGERSRLLRGPTSSCSTVSGSMLPRAMCFTLDGAVTTGGEYQPRTEPP